MIAMFEYDAIRKFCPLRCGNCKGRQCMAWTTDLTNKDLLPFNNDGCEPLLKARGIQCGGDCDACLLHLGKCALMR